MTPNYTKVVYLVSLNHRNTTVSVTFLWVCEELVLFKETIHDSNCVYHTQYLFITKRMKYSPLSKTTTYLLTFDWLIKKTILIV